MSRSDTKVPEVLPSSRESLGSAPARQQELEKGTASAISYPPYHLLAAALLVLLSPLLWSCPPALSAWSPSAGLALVLVAWWGFRALPPLLLAAVVLVLRQALGGATQVSLSWAAQEAVLLVVGPFLAWGLYHALCDGARQLRGPRSAILFVLLVPGLAALVLALARLPLALRLFGEEAGATPLGLLARLWLDWALGVAVVAPPLLVVATEWLERAGLAVPETYKRQDGRAPAFAERPLVAASTAGPAAPSWGDWAETAGLCLAAATLCLLVLVGLRDTSGEQMGWQLWGGQVLLIIWASTRQGLRGGTLAAASAAVGAMVALQALAPLEDGWLVRSLQAQLLVQGCAALLISAATSWARDHEAGYRQVVAHVPVVIYSARLTADGSAEVVLVSAACNKLLGSSAEELLGNHSLWLARVHPDDRELVQAAVSQLRRQDGPVTCEYRLVGHNGEGTGPRWARDTLAPHRDAEGRLIGWEGVVMDVTEQRLLADDLRRTTSMLNGLLTNLPVGVFFVQGPHGTPILVNARARQLLGQREDAGASFNLLSRALRLHKADGTQYPVEELPVGLALKQGRTTMRDDIVVHRPDGRRMPLVSWAAPVTLAGRNGPDAAVWVLQDLTAVHQAEAAREDSEVRLRAIIEAMAEGLLVYDASGAIISCNPSACAFFGLPAERIRGKAFSDLGWEILREDGTPLPPEERPFRVVLKSGRPARNVVLGVLPENATPSSDSGHLPGTLVRWALVNSVPLVGPTGVVGVVTTFTDITAYVQARDATRFSEERFRGLVESLPLMVILSDRDMRLTYINPATEATSGYSLEEVKEPAVWCSLIHVEDLPGVMELFNGAWAGQSGRCELRYSAKDGSPRVGMMLIQPRKQGEEIIGALVLMIDVTRERKLELDLQRSQRLEMVGRLASGVAHDFNNLLGVVLNLADLAQAHVPPGHPAHADLKRITEAGEQAVSLASQLLTFTRNRAVTNQRSSLGEVVRRALTLLRASLPASVVVEANLAEEGTEVQVDETRLQQVVMNLCLNARDAMPEGGRLQVRAVAENGGVVLEVQDSGQGMPEEVQRRIFEPFYSTKETGTGLGLAVVQQIVESSQGTVSVESEVGQGSRFTIRWPVA
jgi:PAS domain S-box-containing protein